MLRADVARRPGQQALGAGGLGEGDDLAQRIGAGEQHGQAVEAQRDAAVRRGAVGQGFQQEAELLLGFGLADAEQRKDFFLHVGAVDTDAAAAEFHAVEHHVVGERARLGRVGVEQRQVGVVGRGERVVFGNVAPFVRVVFDQRKLGDPQKLHGVLVHQAERLAEMQAQTRQHVARHRFPVGDQQQQVLRFQVQRGFDGFLAIVAHEFGQRRLPAGVGEPDPRQTLGPEVLGERNQVVQFLARERVVRHHQSAHHTALGDDLAEDLDVRLAEQRGHLADFQPEAQVGFIVPEAGHDFRVRQARKRDGHVDAFDLLAQPRQHALDEAEDVVGPHERRLDVDLGELGLAVGAQVLVAEAAHDLEVFFQAADHQKLLEQLRRLRQGVEPTRVDAARHQIIARAFGRAARQHRRFDLQEAVFVEMRTHDLRQPVAQAQVLEHPGPPQIEIAVTQPSIFHGFDVAVEREGRGVRRVEHAQFLDDQLDLAGRQIGVHRFGRAAFQAPAGSHDVFRAQVLGAGVRRLADLGIADDLDQAGSVAHVDERDAAVIAARPHPAHDGQRLPDPIRAGLSAIAAPSPVA